MPSKYFNGSMESLLGQDNNQVASNGREVVVRVSLSPAKMRRVAKQMERITGESKSLIEEIKGVAG